MLNQIPYLTEFTVSVLWLHLLLLACIHAVSLLSDVMEFANLPLPSYTLLFCLVFVKPLARDILGTDCMWSFFPCLSLIKKGPVFYFTSTVANSSA